MARSTCIAVLSGGRSGSSCVAGVLYTLGIYMGAELIGRSPSNRMAHFEDLEFVDLHRQMVGDWRHAKLSVSGPGSAYRQLVRRREQRQLWGLKDPRLCFTFRFLTDTLSDDTTLKAIRVWRDPNVSAASMVARAKREPHVEHLQVTLPQAKRIARAYHAALEESLNGWEGPLLAVDYNELVDDPPAGIEAIAHFCGIPSNARAVAFVKPGLRHHR